MAQKVELEFEGGGSLVEYLERVDRGVAALGNRHKAVANDIRTDMVRNAEATNKFNQNVAVAAKVVTDMGKQVAATDISGKMIAGSEAASNLRENVEEVREVAGGASEELTNVGKAAQGAAKGSSDAISKLRIDVQRTGAATAGVVKITADQYKNIAAQITKAGVSEDQLLDKVAQTAAAQDDLNKKANEYAPSLEPADEAVQSLQQELRAATAEAGRLAAEFGVDSEQAIVAQERVGELRNAVDNLRQRFDAFDPGKKLQAFNQLSFSLISGLSAVQGLTGLLAGENAALEKTLFAFQSILFASTGIQQFIGGFKDSLSTLRAVFGVTTAATVANTAANTANAASTAAAGTAAATSAGGFGILTTSVKAFTVSLLTNPIFLIIAAVVALGAAILSAGDDAEEAKKDFDALIATLQRFRDIEDAVADMKRELDDIDVERLRIGLDENDFAGQANLLRKSVENELNALNTKERIRRNEIALRQKQLQENEALNDLSEEELKQYNQDILALEIEANGLRAEQTVVRARGYLELAKIEKSAQEQAKLDAKERKALLEDLLEFERDLSRRVRQEARQFAGEADPFQRVELERRAAEEEINELERGFKRKIALIKLQKTIGAQAFRELTEEEKRVRADALIDRENIQLPAKQQEQFDNLRLLLAARTERDLTELQLAAATERARILQDSAAKETQVFELELEAKRRSLIKAGVDLLEVDAFVDRERKRFAREQAQEAIQLDEDLQTAIVNGRQNNGEIEKRFERQKQLDLLNIKLVAARAQLALIEEDGTKETALLRQNLQNTINEVEKARQDLLDNPVRINLLDLLGVKEEDQAAVKSALNNIVASFQQTMSLIIAAQQQEVQAQIAATDAILSDQNRRRGELEAQLKEEERRREQGLSSNVEKTKEALAQVQRAERAAAAEKVRLQEEQERLARRQAQVNALTQASNMVTAASTLFSEEVAKGGVVGVVTAIAGLAAMIAAFVSFQQSVDAATEFGDGGWIGGKSHAEGGTPIVAEKDEFVVKKAQAKKHNKLVEAINEDDWRGVSLKDLQPVLDNLNISLDNSAMNEVIRDGRVYNSTSLHMRTEALEASMGEVVNELRGVREDLRKGSTERITYTSDGGRIIERPGETTIIRPSK